MTFFDNVDDNGAFPQPKKCNIHWFGIKEAFVNENFFG